MLERGIKEVDQLEVMTTKEIQLILILSSPCLTDHMVEELNDLMLQHLRWSEVLGQLSLHRTAGLAYKNLKDSLIDKRNKFTSSNFLKALELIYKAQSISELEQLAYNKNVLSLLDKSNIEYAIVKGCSVSQSIYPENGVRFFSDNDILINERDISSVSNLLLEYGYVQGWWNYRANSVNTVTRADKLFWMLNSHQTHPFLIPTPEANCLDFHKIDLQFSLDLMTGSRTGDLVAAVLSNRQKFEINEGGSLWSLKNEDMFVFICLHFYKEATHISEVKRLNDLLLYKIVDICRFFLASDIKWDHDSLLHSISMLNLNNEVYYALHYTNEVFPNIIPNALLEKIRPESVSYLYEIKRSDNTTVSWNSSIVSRFFDQNRLAQLRPG